jgi:O-methyltransferase
MRDSYNDHKIRRDQPSNWLNGHPIISDQISRESLSVICKQLREILAADIPGAIVEFGCYVGTTSLFIRRELDAAGGSERRPFHVYDSFEGLPPKTAPDTSAAGVDFEPGKLYVSKREFLQQFHAANLRPPTIHKDWFGELTDADVPPEIAFAFLDGDFYESIIDSLRLVWPRLSPGGRIIIDDYQREALPGVDRAIRDFTQRKAVQIRAEQNLAILFTK